MGLRHGIERSFDGFDQFSVSAFVRTRHAGRRHGAGAQFPIDFLPNFGVRGEIGGEGWVERETARFNRRVMAAETVLFNRGADGLCGLTDTEDGARQQ